VSCLCVQISPLIFRSRHRFSVGFDPVCVPPGLAGLIRCPASSWVCCGAEDSILPPLDRCQRFSFLLCLLLRVSLVRLIFLRSTWFLWISQPRLWLVPSDLEFLFSCVSSRSSPGLDFSWSSWWFRAPESVSSFSRSSSSFCYQGPYFSDVLRFQFCEGACRRNSILLLSHRI
jgi:hypothetical protein